MKIQPTYEYEILIPIIGMMVSDEVGCFDGDDYMDLSSEQVRYLDANVDDNNTLDSYMEDNKDDLIKYADADLTRFIKHIKVGEIDRDFSCEMIYVKVTVESSVDLHDDAKLKEKLFDYLQGQMSDGWGENFVDCFCKRDATRTTIEWDEEECTLFEDSCELYYWAELETDIDATGWEFTLIRFKEEQVPETLEEAMKVIEDLKKKSASR